MPFLPNVLGSWPGLPCSLRLGTCHSAEKGTASSQRDVERRRTAKAYARIRRTLLLAELIVALGGVLLLLFVASRPLVGLVEQFTTNPWLVVFTYVASLSIVYSVVTFPLDYYSGFVLPRRYGLSTQTLRGWLWDQTKGAVVGAALGFPLAEGLYWLLRVAPNTWWVWAAGGMLVVNVGLSSLAPVLILPLFYELTPLDDPDLVTRLSRLTARVGRHAENVYTIGLGAKTTAANAALVGLGRTRRILLGDTLYERYTGQEIESILAHELGHDVHHDLALGIAFSAVLTLVGMWVASLVLRWGVTVFGFRSLGDVAAFPLLALTALLLGLFTLPLGNAFSRWRERLADRFALDITANPEAFRCAILKLADQNLADVEPERWVVWLLYSHPPIRERVAMAGHDQADEASS